MEKKQTGRNFKRSFYLTIVRLLNARDSKDQPTYLYKCSLYIFRLKSGTSDEETTQVTLKAPNSKHASRESLTICNTSNSGRGGSTIGGSGGSTVEGRSGSLGVSVAMPSEQKSFNSYSKRDLAKTENDSAMTKAVTTTTSSTTDLASKKQQCITKATVSSRTRR